MVAMSKEVKERYWAKKQLEAPVIQCACGCGETLKAVDKYGRKATYITGHNGRRYPLSESGRAHAAKRWKARLTLGEKATLKRDRYRSQKLRCMRLMGGKCQHCELEYDGKNAPAFEFHHVDPETKDDSVTRMLTNENWEKVKEELAKCILICANCHNQHHGGQW